MKLQTKQFIAKEFLILIITISLGLITFLCTFPYNYLKSKKVDKLGKAIAVKTKERDSLNKFYNLKSDNQKLFFWEFINRSDRMRAAGFKQREDIWERLDDLAKKDSIKSKWEKEWAQPMISFLNEYGFSNADSFNEFILSNRINTIDFDNYQQSLKIDQDIFSIKSQITIADKQILSFNEQINFAIKSTIIFAIILFGFRYLYHSIRWSLRTLNQNTE